jgi:hypothetical protein
MSLDIKRKQLELRRVENARMDLELKIAERQDEIARLESLVLVQQETEDRLKKELQALIK